MKPSKSEARRKLTITKLILDGIEYGFWVPQQLIGEVNLPPKENPKVPDEDGDKPLFGFDNDDQYGIPI